MRVLSGLGVPELYPVPVLQVRHWLAVVPEQVKQEAWQLAAGNVQIFPPVTEEVVSVNPPGHPRHLVSSSPKHPSQVA